MSNMRISGLVSGMDTDAMVQSMMKVERLKVDRYEQSKQIALWRQEAYINTNKMFANFILNTQKDMGLKKASSTGSLSNVSYSRLDYVRKATSSNETAATVSATSEAVNGSYEIKVEKLATNAKLNSNKVDKDQTFGNEITINLGGNDIIVKNENGVKLSDIAKEINNSKQGINAFFEVDSTNKGILFLQTSKTGEVQTINLTATGSNSSEFLDLFTEKNARGENSQIKFNGQTLNYNDNNIKFNGLNIQLKAEGVTNINVNTNVDGIMEKIEKFVNDYNELIDKTSKLVSEKRYSNYHPLSQEEKKAMHEDDVKLWQEKAKSGMLNRDETIQRTLQNIRTDLYKNVEGLDGSFKHITEIGITTEKYSKGTTGGKLQIDKDKLRAAIEKDPEGVMKLLFNEPDVKKDGMSEAEYKKAVSNKSGVFTRIYDNLTDGMKTIIDKSGPGEDADLFRSVQFNILIDFRTKKSSISDLDKEILDANKKIDDLNAMLYRKENAYYAKFANMEKMLSQMNSQSKWLSQQFMR
ncbi:flagellar hook-associated protein 2 [Tissierella praeacuta]|uniref:flagellar filament capping protein FliD n=1 Tax=Tissierella praeacuta TaxID=43131 RepID=UPI0010534F58|nr:flagellar filament capping protein FliD [Tissierella praeacuta]TCU65773.1 flagellar hook-associated protein 2 [Tissierella praeacuta]